MNSSTYRRPGAFSPRPPSSPNIFQGAAANADPDESDSSTYSQHIPTQPQEHRSPKPQQLARPALYQSSTANTSTTSINNFSRPGFGRQASSEVPIRHSGSEFKGHKREHSQGFFEPSLPTATLSDQSIMANLTASQIAAQAAMQHQSSSQHSRQRSQTIPSPHQSPPGTVNRRGKPPPIQTAPDNAGRRPSGPQTPGRQFYNGAIGGHSAAATTAANAAFPQSTKLSPGLTSFEPPVEKEHKLKSERSKMKLFSKPKSSSNKDLEKDKPLPSPNKTGPQGLSGLSKVVNPSTTSLADPLASGAASIYSMNTTNASTSTLIPSDRQSNEKEKAHKHHFLSRQKNKLKDKIGDDHSLPLSSASSNSRPLDPNAPSSLYSFTPTPASPASTSFSGLDLRHAGKALREKKKEERTIPFAPKKSDIERTDWAPLGISTPGGSLFGNQSAIEVTSGAALQSFGLHNMRSEDAWPYLRAKLLPVFEREELRIPVEDLNRLVTVHLQRCIVNRNPTMITEDLRDFLNTGFLSLDQNLRNHPDHRLVPHLVEHWLFVFGTLLPYMQAVFLPLDLEFKGHGSLMSSSEAAEFWGANPDATDDAFGNEFDVRRVVLLSYRDIVILPRYEVLKATFSRLSLDSINANASPVVDSFDTLTSSSSARPGTAGSLDPGLASYNSQGSTLLGDVSTSSRSRAASNLSAPELPSFNASPAMNNRQRQVLPDSSHVTETVGRVLQCVSVLASVQSGDDAQSKMEDLAKALKLNWLGRGRTGRNRKGFVGGRVKVARRDGGDVIRGGVT